LRVLMLAAPGAGKGTQGALIAEHFGVPHIATGDLLRDRVSRETELCQQVKRFLDNGDLVPDGIVLDMVRGALEAAKKDSGGYVLDGLPRAADALAAGIAAIVAVADPELIVGGSVALGQLSWLRSVTERARARCISQAGAAMRVAPAGLGSHAALAGAAELAVRAAELAVRAASRPAPGQDGSSGLVGFLGAEQGRDKPECA